MITGIMRLFTLSLFFFSLVAVQAQTVSERLNVAFQKFESDLQLQNALSSLYVVEAKTGVVVFQKNAGVGLAPASTQKLITAATAYELLGKDFRYKTEFGVERGKDGSQLFIQPSGDPSLGSWRWERTKEANVLSRVAAAIRKTAAGNIGPVVVYSNGWTRQTIPDGWIWQDIGNYYGAGAGLLNWRENQFDLFLKSGNNIGDAVEIVGTKPALYGYELSSLATAAGKGSGDNAYIYFGLNGQVGVVQGTIPIQEKKFSISGAFPQPEVQFAASLFDSLGSLVKKDHPVSPLFVPGNPLANSVLHTEYSPPLDSLVYWLNKKSINLYGESLLKTMAVLRSGTGSTEKGVAVVRDFWKSRGIPASELNISDGSGLSPLNRTTTRAQVAILQHALKQSWYPGFYQSLPEYNGMKMKSGTIQDVKGFTGYHTSAKGVQYAFSFLVNNYNGSAAALVQKMYAVLNVLK